MEMFKGTPPLLPSQHIGHSIPFFTEIFLKTIVSTVDRMESKEMLMGYGMDLRV
jgi:hypothetical protein